MATINSKKLLPGSEKKEVFLVPTKNIVPSAPKLEGVKPSEKKATKTPLLLEGKVIQVTELFNNNLLLKAADRERKRKDEERKEFEEREKKLEEKKLGKKGQQESLASKSKIPGFGIFDTLARFTGFTLLGFVFNNYSNLLPRLTALGAIIKPAAVGLGYFAEAILSGAVDWIEKGYKAYDIVRDWTKKLGGENFQKLFDDFSGALNVFLNAAIITGLAGARGDALKKGSNLFDDTVKKSRRLLKSGVARQLVGTETVRRANEQSFRMLQAVRRSQQKQDLQARLAGVGQRVRAERARKREIARSAQKRTGGIEGGAQTVTAKRIQDKVFMSGDVDPSTQRPKKVRGPRKIESGVLVSDLQIQKGAFTFGEEFGQEISTPTRPTSVRGLYKEVTIPGVNSKGIPFGKKRFPPDVADTIEYIAKKYGAGSKQVQRAFEDPEFYKYELRKAYRNMMNEKLKPSKRGVKPPTRRAIRAPRPPRKPPKFIGAKFAPGTKTAKGPFAGLSKGLSKVTGTIGGLYKRIPIIGRIPVLGPLFDVIVSLALGDPIEKAVVAATGAAAFSGLFGFLGSLGFPFVGTAIGVAVGGFIGDALGRFAYDRFEESRENKKTKKYAQGGVVGSRRRIRVTQKPKSKGREPSPANIREGFTENDLEYVYGKQNAKSTVDIIKRVSGNLGEIAMFNGFLGSLMAGSINLLLGQKFDSGLLRYIGQKYGKQTENGVRSAGDAVINSLRKFITFKKEEGDEPGRDGGGGGGGYGGGGGGGALPPLREPKRSDFPMGRGGTKAYERALERYKSEKARRQQQAQAQVQPQTPTLPGVSGGLIDTGYKDSLGRPIKLKGAAADAFIQMAADAKKQGIDIGPGVSNAFRTPEHNARVGGAGSSKHLQGLAFDINWYTNAGKWIRENAPGYGFRFNDYSGTSTHFDYIGGGAKIKPASTSSTPELGRQSSTKKDDAQQVAMNTTYEVVTNSILMVKTYIQQVPAVMA